MNSKFHPESSFFKNEDSLHCFYSYNNLQFNNDPPDYFFSATEQMKKKTKNRIYVDTAYSRIQYNTVKFNYNSEVKWIIHVVEKVSYPNFFLIMPKSFHNTMQTCDGFRKNFEIESFWLRSQEQYNSSSYNIIVRNIINSVPTRIQYIVNILNHQMENRLRGDDFIFQIHTFYW